MSVVSLACTVVLSGMAQDYRLVVGYLSFSGLPQLRYNRRCRHVPLSQMVLSTRIRKLEMLCPSNCKFWGVCLAAAAAGNCMDDKGAVPGAGAASSKMYEVNKTAITTPGV